MRIVPVLIFAIIALSSCVTSKVHEDLQSKYDLLNNENESLRLKNQEYEVSLKEIKARLDKAEKDIKVMEKDTVDMSYQLRKSRKNYNDLNKQYEFLLNNNSSLLADNARQNKELLERLEDLQEELELKEDSLNLEQQRLQAYQEDLERKNKRLVQLEGIVNRQDSTMKYIQNKLSDALMGFEGKGLSIEMRDGKVYVSLENSLLFASGSWTVSSNGKVALDNLAQVLADNPDINILVEGHTDTDAFRGSGQVKDNWDLSVMRATSVVKIITSNEGVNKGRITAGGKGEYFPIATNDTKEGKAQNRRIEVVLTPDLEGLFDIVD